MLVWLPLRERGRYSRAFSIRSRAMRRSSKTTTLMIATPQIQRIALPGVRKIDEDRFLCSVASSRPLARGDDLGSPGGELGESDTTGDVSFVSLVFELDLDLDFEREVRLWDESFFLIFLPSSNILRNRVCIGIFGTEKYPN